MSPALQDNISTIKDILPNWTVHANAIVSLESNVMVMTQLSHYQKLNDAWAIREHMVLGKEMEAQKAGSFQKVANLF